MQTTRQAFTNNRDTAPAYWSGDILWIMLATSQDTNGHFSLMEQLCSAGSGPMSHLHLEQDETFFLIDGSVEFTVNGATFTAGAGDFVAIPRSTPHSFKVTSPTSRMLNAYYPAGFEQVILQSAVPATERTLPPKGLPLPDRDTGMQLARQYGMAFLDKMPVPIAVGAKPLHVKAGDGKAYWEVGILWILMAEAEETAGSHSFLDELLPTGLAAPPHRHEAADEIFYIMEGEATFTAGEANTALKATAGSLVFIPRQTRHSFQIDSPTARLLNAYTPAGFEHTIPPVGVPATERTLPPATLPPTDMQAAMQIIADVHNKYPGALTTVFVEDFLDHDAMQNG